MKKSDIKVMPEYYNRYIDLVNDMDLSEAVDESTKQIEALDKELLKKLGHSTYAPGKWTAKDILQHLIDTERIMNYRILLFAREENGSTPGFEEDSYALKANAKKRDIVDLLEEYRAVRLSTKHLLKSLDEESLGRKGKAWNYEISVGAIGFMIIGHQMHHFKVLEEKYFPLVS